MLSYITIIVFLHGQIDIILQKVFWISDFYVTGKYLYVSTKLKGKGLLLLSSWQDYGVGF